MNNESKGSLAHNKSSAIKLIENKWVQSGIAGIPFVGGPIQSYLSNVVSDLDKKKWEEYWSSVEVRIVELDENKIDFNYFTSEDFVQRLRVMYSQVTSGCDNTKLEYLRDYFVTCASKVDIDITWKDIFLKYLGEMNGVHLMILRIFLDNQGNLSYKDRFELPQRISNSPLCIKDISHALHTHDTYLVEMVVADLSSTGLISAWNGEPKEPKGWSINDSGIKFMKFLTGLWA